MRLAATIAITLATAACGATAENAPARFSDSWPTATRSFAAVAADWTRSGNLVSGYDKVLEVSATFLSPEWRAAYVSERSKSELMGAEARDALVSAQQADAREFYEVELLVATYRHEENELQKGDKSMWRVALADDQGNEILPVEIRRDRRSFEVLRTYFPELDRFHTAYIARFPRTLDLMREGARRFSLKIASARGGVELVWTAR